MKPSIEEKLTRLVERYEEIAHLLSDPTVIADTDKFRDLSKEYARLEPVAKDFGAYKELARDLADAREMSESDDAELKALGDEEWPVPYGSAGRPARSRCPDRSGTAGGWRWAHPDRC